MKRDIFKYAETGIKKLEKTQAYSLSLNELRELINHNIQPANAEDLQDGICEAITIAYAAGFEAGARYEKNRRKA